MLKRHIKKHALKRRQPFIETCREGAACHSPCGRIGREGTRRITEHVARQLIQQEHQREAGAWLVLPLIKLACRCRRIVAGKSLDAKTIEVRICYEPSPLMIVARRFIGSEPELKDSVRISHKPC